MKPPGREERRDWVFDAWNLLGALNLCPAALFHRKQRRTNLRAILFRRLRQAGRPPYFCSFFAVSHSKVSLTSSPVENTASFVGGVIPELVIFTEGEPVNFSLSAPMRTRDTGI